MSFITTEVINYEEIEQIRTFVIAQPLVLYSYVYFATLKQAVSNLVFNITCKLKIKNKRYLIQLFPLWYTS